MLAWLFLVAIVMTGCATPGVPAATSESVPPFISRLQSAPRYALTAQEMAALRSRILSQLKDPESARFGPVIASKEPSGEVMVCGLVNAKNSFGGYTGMKTYYASLSGGAVKSVTLSEGLERFRITLYPCPAS